VVVIVVIFVIVVIVVIVATVSRCCTLTKDDVVPKMQCVETLSRSAKGSFC
jgi:hypothetical protein